MAVYQIIQPDNAVTTYNISNGTYCVVRYVDGIGMPEIERIREEFPNVEGAKDFGFRLRPRTITLGLFFQVASLGLMDARREALYRIFRPFDLPLKFKVTRDVGDVRQIDCHVVGTNNFLQSERVGSSQQFTVRLLAPNPIWIDPTQITKTITPSASPWSGETISYLGTTWEYPIVKVYGSVTNFTMTFTSLLGTVTFELSNIAAGANVTFDCRPGYKTVLSSTGANLLNSISTNARRALYNFRLWQPPYVVGNHSFSGSYSTKDANHKIEILYYSRYWGI